MKVVLACPGDWITDPLTSETMGWLGNPDETVEVSDALGQRLIMEGKARSTDTLPRTADELQSVADAERIHLAGAKTVAEKRARIEAARDHKEG
jgi:hypothetical protein